MSRLDGVSSSRAYVGCHSLVRALELHEKIVELGPILSRDGELAMFTILDVLRRD